MGKHTEEQMRRWERYEKIRLKGEYNMLSPNARVSTGLSKEEYFYCLKNYSSLKEQALIDKESI